MDNYFDQFDAPAGGAGDGNYFDQFDGQAVADAKPPQSGGALEFAADAGKAVGAGAVSATGFSLQGVGEAIREFADAGLGMNLTHGYANQGARKVVDAATKPAVNPLAGAAEVVTGWGDDVRGWMSLDAQQAMADSTPTGDILTMENLSWGTDATVKGYSLNALNVMGQIAPFVATAALTKGQSVAGMLTAEAGTGAVLGGGAASIEADDWVRSLSDEQLDGVPVYQAMLDEGMSQELALDDLALMASTGAFRRAAPVGALSGLILGGPLSSGGQRALGKVLGQSRKARVVGGVAIAAPLEGLQEVTEGVAMRTGAAEAIGVERAPGEGSAAEFVLGAMGGAGPAAIGGMMPTGEQQHDQALADLDNATDVESALAAAAAAIDAPMDVVGDVVADAAAPVQAAGFVGPVMNPTPITGVEDVTGQVIAPLEAEIATQGVGGFDEGLPPVEAYGQELAVDPVEPGQQPNFFDQFDEQPAAVEPVVDLPFDPETGEILQPAAVEAPQQVGPPAFLGPRRPAGVDQVAVVEPPPELPAETAIAEKPADAGFFNGEPRPSEERSAETTNDDPVYAPFSNGVPGSSEVNKRKSFGWDAYELSRHYTAKELGEWIQELLGDPDNKSLEGGLELYNKTTKKKLDQLSWAVTHIVKAGKGESLTTIVEDEAATEAEVKQSLEKKKPLLSEVIQDVNDKSVVLGSADAVSGDEAPNLEDLSNGYIENHKSFMRALRVGGVTPGDVGIHHGLISSNKDLVMSELVKLTKKNLLKMLGGMGAARYRSEKKGRVVEAAYSEMISDMVLGDSVSYFVDGKDSHEKAVKVMVDAYTEADIEKYAADYASRLAAYKERVNKFKKALDDPETIDDFETFIRANGKGALSSDQAAKYDQLTADRGRGRRQQEAEQKASIAQVEIGTVGMEIIETEHTRDKYPLFVVKLSDRVERDTYKTLLQSAKKLGGWYSRFSKSGAVPGFQFKSREAAGKFVGLREGGIDGADLVGEASETRKTTTVSKLRALANRMTGKADESLSQDRRANTARQARMAAGAEASAESSKAVAATIARIADAYDSGEIKYLDKLSSRTQVDELDRALYQARHVRERKEGRSYAEQQAGEGRPYDAADIEHAKAPVPGSNTGMIKSAALKLEDVAGAKRLAAKMLNRVAGKQEEFVEFSSPSDIDLFRFFVKKAGDNLGWYAEEGLARYDRMARMGITNDAEMRSVLREYIGYKQAPAQEDPMKARERGLIGMKIPGFFPTPPAVIEMMLAEASIEEGDTVLEPSAGTGNIAEAAKNAGAKVVALEVNSTLAEILEEKGFDVAGRDFLDHDEKYDHVLMNPPFEKGQDIDHVRHAYELLNPGGRIVAIMSEGPFFRGDKKATDFRGWLSDVGWSEKLPDGSFKNTKEVSQTGVNARLVVIDRVNEEQGARFKAADDQDAFLRQVSAALEPVSEQQARDWLGGFLQKLKLDDGAVDVEVVRTEAGLPESLRRKVERQGMDGQVQGVYTGGKVYVVSSALSSEAELQAVVLHEVYGHHGGRKLFGAEYRPAMRRLFMAMGGEAGIKALADKYGLQMNSYFKAAESMAADERSVLLVDELLARLAEQGALETFTGRIKRRLQELLGVIRQWLRDHGMAALAKEYTDADLFGLLRSMRKVVQDGDGVVVGRREPVGAFKAGDDEANFAVADVSESVKAQTKQAKKLWQAAGEKASDFWATHGHRLLAVLTLRQFAEVVGDDAVQVGGMVDVMQGYQIERNKMMEGSQKLAARWMKLPKATASALADLMHLATMAGVDPAVEYAPAVDVKETRARIAQIKRLMAGSPGEAGWIMKGWRDELKQAQIDLGKEARRKKVHPQLERVWNGLSDEAQGIYEAARDDYIKSSQRMEEAQVASLQQAMAEGKARKLAIAKLRKEFEAGRVEAPYFPLQRFGQFYLVAKRDDETAFFMYESVSQRRRGERDVKADGWTVERTGKKSEFAGEVDSVSAGFVTEVVAGLKEKFGDSSGAEAGDVVYQAFLQSLPYMSNRVHFIHRRKTAGYSGDAIRAFAFNQAHMANQVARMEVQPEAQRLLDELDEQIKTSTELDVTRLEAVAEELKRRHEWLMNPSGGRLASVGTAIGFAFYLGLTPAAAIVNLTQTPIVALPVIGARYGFDKTAKALAKGMKEAGAARGLGRDRHDYSQWKGLTDNERSAFGAWHDEGAIDVTQTQALMGMAESESAGYSPKWAKAMETVGWMFQEAEVVNREATLLAAYRLAVDKGLGHERAVAEAGDLTFKAHFDYSNANRARVMQGDWQKVLLLFRSYSQHITYLMFRNAWVGRPGAKADPEAARIARRELLGVLGMTALLGGTTALPIGVVFGIANAVAGMFGGDDEPWDAETEFRDWLAGAGLAGAMVDRGVVNAATGADLSSRISLDELWIRSPYRGLEARQMYGHYLEQAAGPVFGLGGKALRSVGLAADGYHQRAFENAVPKFMKDGLQAMRFAGEGVLNMKGDPVVNELEPLEIALKAAGFNPDRVNAQYDANNHAKNYESFVVERRRRLMRDYGVAYLAGDTAAALKVRRKMRVFNRHNPTYRINQESIKRSLRSRQRYRDQADQGIQLSKKLRHLRNETEIAH